MCRFIKEEAEALGWAFAHSSEEEVTITSETQGETRVRPASVRAEKSLSGGGMINEEAESIGKLLERIHAYEEQATSKRIETTPVPVAEETIPIDPDTELPIRTVITAEGKITEEELASRSRQDAIATEDGMEFHGHRPAISELEAARAEHSTETESERTAAEEIPHEVVEVDDSQTVVDLPGGATGSVLVVREGEELDEVQPRRIAEKTEAEESKSLVAPVPDAEIGIDDPGEEPEETDDGAEDQAPEVDATPAAEEAAAEREIDLADVEGTGKDGRVTKADVEEYDGEE
jgi:pyruvate/2-oxoglutarate dehydrogenase complex dihydrolipoamide acyltransferase (E2) component